eukprot:UN05532
MVLLHLMLHLNIINMDLDENQMKKLFAFRQGITFTFIIIYYSSKVSYSIDYITIIYFVMNYFC